MAGFPRWDDEAAAYPTAGATSPTQWAWEFLRRRSDYQRDYDELVKPAVLEGGGIVDGRLLRFIEERYGLTFPINPTKKTALGPLFIDQFVSEISDHGDGKPQSVEVNPGEAWILFDLRRPLSAQFDRAAKVLEQDQQYYLWKTGQILSRFRERSKKWSLYLRLLDAEAAGVPVREIAARLFSDLPNNDPEYAASVAVRKSLKAAKRIQGSYRAIANLSSRENKSGRYLS